MSDCKDFLFEIGTEEMPSAPLNNAVSQLGKLITTGLDASGLAHGEVRVISSPRRLAALVKDLSCATEEVHEIKRGPGVEIAFDANGEPTRAAAGFARKFGLAAEELVRRVDDDGREYVFAEKNVPSRAAEPILTELCEKTISDLQWPNYRSQRWGSGRATFVRPVRWICCLLGDAVVPVSYADVTSGNTTRGHRVLGPGDHAVPTPADYERVLEENGVLSAERRREVILEGVKKIETERAGAHVDMPKKVFEEVVNLCEWPTVLVGTFDEEFLKVPHEIICESMLTNQRYFPIYDADGNLTREFVIVSNTKPENSARVIDGNERVVRPRLDDAKFFYEEDLKVSLDEFRERLARVNFQEKLGNVLQKSERIELLALAIARECHLGAQASADCARAAHLCKADLVSNAVVEFTSQQGVMGGYYAKAAGETDEVATAIRDHYRPRFAGDDLPEGTAGCVVAVADKIDTITGIFAIGEPPTGSSDPYALRRSAIGVINILRSRLKIDLTPLIAASLDAYAEQGIEFDKDAIENDVRAFFAGRLASIAKDEKIPADTVAAVADVDVIAPAEFFARCAALDSARQNDRETFENLATAYARAAHIAKPELGCDVDRELLTEPEIALLDASVSAKEAVDSALAAHDYDAAFAALASLRSPIDRFFDEVMVMDENQALRENRLRLLNEFLSAFARVANIGELARKGKK